jgi:hypothetical protein
MAQAKAVKVKITRDCEGPGDGYTADEVVTVSEKDAELLRRRGFGVIVKDAPPAK